MIRQGATALASIAAAVILGAILAVAVLSLLQPTGMHPLVQAAIAAILMSFGLVLLGLLYRAALAIQGWWRRSN